MFVRAHIKIPQQQIFYMLLFEVASAVVMVMVVSMALLLLFLLLHSTFIIRRALKQIIFGVRDEHVNSGLLFGSSFFSKNNEKN